MIDEQRKRIHDIVYSCDDRAELAERIVALEDERDKVSKERDYLLMNANPTATELRRVRRAWKNDRAENAKLRELVREAVDAASLKDMRDWRYGKRLAFLREARELGVEG